MNLTKTFTQLLLIVLSVQSMAQNLVKNGSFENYTELPTEQSQWHLCNGWFTAAATTEDPDGNPDYFHVDGSFPVQLPSTSPAYVEPHSGDAVMGFLAYHENNGTDEVREYLVTKLFEPLEVGKSYQVTFYLTNGSDQHGYRYSINMLGVNLTTDAPQQTGFSHLDVIPTVGSVENIFYTDWQKYSFVTRVTEPFQYLTIGCFGSNNEVTPELVSNGPFHGAYYYVDDVSVKEVEDNLTDVENPLKESNFNLYPTQTQKEITVECTAETKNANYQIYDGLGNLMSKGTFNTKQTIDVSHLVPGVYFINCTTQTGQRTMKFSKD